MRAVSEGNINMFSSYVYSCTNKKPPFPYILAVTAVVPSRTEQKPVSAATMITELLPLNTNGIHSKSHLILPRSKYP